MINFNDYFYHVDGVLYSRHSRGRIKKGDIVGSLSSNGYLQVELLKNKYKVHRIIFYIENGYLPEIVDHIDGDKLNNKPSNLRAATKGQNNRNSKTPKTNKSGVKGVHWCKTREKWTASIFYRKNKIFLGYFDCIDDAENKVRNSREELHGEFCNHGLTQTNSEAG